VIRVILNFLMSKQKLINLESELSTLPFLLSPQSIFQQTLHRRFDLVDVGNHGEFQDAV
jgi:hypothetical protein